MTKPKPDRVLPSPAGMVRARDRRSSARRGAPRARGDGPHSQANTKKAYSCSPRPRGWSGGTGPRQVSWRVLPAPAGMVRCSSTGGTLPKSAPRACGDDPYAAEYTTADTECSPRPPGMIPLVGTRRPMTRCAPPRPRGGWSERAMTHSVRVGGLPRPGGDGPRTRSCRTPPSSCFHDGRVLIGRNPDPTGACSACWTSFRLTADCRHDDDVVELLARHRLRSAAQGGEKAV